MYMNWIAMLGKKISGKRHELKEFCQATKKVQRGKAVIQSNNAQ